MRRCFEWDGGEDEMRYGGKVLTGRQFCGFVDLPARSDLIVSFNGCFYLAVRSDNTWFYGKLWNRKTQAYVHAQVSSDIQTPPSSSPSSTILALRILT